ncbi:MtnX-like HAD-IB family phosphatase [Clostridium sp. DJ247]|uniref:MtnX-like HAD-IB family phosphatase n=1 Tax=Clostridium sp. DJ247 TaxID=2726188 RepID=UPI001626383C|nr:MtnX-like HAD-IB family phosphatase [Clostridium sp. DJ247]MBC2581235.1 MtnX-like HAD-IB family phosphatase [Clostridium sp. DJ247]
MEKFVFISDFDGTLTKKDFYKIITDDYLKEECAELYKEWRAKKIKDVDYLGYVFKNIKRNEQEIYEDILKISIDSYAKEFVNNIRLAGGDFIIVSAGTSYYIEKVFEKQEIKDVEIYSNKGVFKDNGIHFVLDESSEFYSEIYGIDKYKVVKKLKEKYNKVFYAGDSEPDLKAALIADVVFAKGSLVELLEKENKEFIKFENFSEVWEKVQNYLRKWDNERNNS